MIENPAFAGFLNLKKQPSFLSCRMKKILLILISIASVSAAVQGQSEESLPRYLTDSERELLPFYTFPQGRGIETPPEFPNLRNMAEWEEIQAVTITWTSYPTILKQIVRAAKEETKVIIFCSSAALVQSYLMGSQAGGPLDNMDNIDLVEANFNSIWIRDYGANTVYGNRVDTLLLTDWIYNRPRPADDVIPQVLANHLGINLYTTTAAPSDLVNTGGNFMSDGQGNAFSSELVLEENESGNPYNVTAKTEEQIDNILSDFQGIDTYIKMTALPYDIINHIDMHMKLLDEETLLVGEYPPGVADGPQINANIDYVINNFQTTFGTDFKVVRIPMPNSTSGLWPDDNPAAYYRTYTNGVFVNKTFIYPSYRPEYDTTAFRIYSELLPGYTLVPIDCDNQPDLIIAAAGAIHCIVHSVGVSDPLLIVHQPLTDTENVSDSYEVIATAEHRSGISGTMLYWRLAGEDIYQSVEMAPSGENSWSGFITAQAAGSEIEYYVEATANSGKVQTRPIVAPEGYWSFKILGTITGLKLVSSAAITTIYPNPARDITTVRIHLDNPTQVAMHLTDQTGRRIIDFYQGEVYQEKNVSINVGDLSPGMYLVVMEGVFGRVTKKIAVAR